MEISDIYTPRQTLKMKLNSDEKQCNMNLYNQGEGVKRRQLDKSLTN